MQTPLPLHNLHTFTFIYPLHATVFLFFCFFFLIQILIEFTLSLVLTLLGIKLQKERGNQNAYSSHYSVCVNQMLRIEFLYRT